MLFLTILLWSAMGGAVILVGYLQVFGWKSAALNQCQRIRAKLFQNILRQHIGWFDVRECGELNNRLSE